MAAGVAALSGIVTSATVGRAGTGVIAAARNGSSGNNPRSIETQQKPPDSGGFFVFRFSGLWPGISGQFAGHPKVTLLNDALLLRLSGPGSGRIAQLVEQMTLNHRVPGSSPGAPTI